MHAYIYTYIAYAYMFALEFVDRYIHTLKASYIYISDSQQEETASWKDKYNQSESVAQRLLNEVQYLRMYVTYVCMYVCMKGKSNQSESEA